MAKQTENNVGIYLRLSQEDMREGDSLSIDNQKLILTKFVQDKGWKLVDEYIDDGYTGTDFSRPGVHRKDQYDCCQGSFQIRTELHRSRQIY